MNSRRRVNSTVVRLTHVSTPLADRFLFLGHLLGHRADGLPHLRVPSELGFSNDSLPLSIFERLNWLGRIHRDNCRRFRGTASVAMAEHGSAGSSHHSVGSPTSHFLFCWCHCYYSLAVHCSCASQTNRVVTDLTTRITNRWTRAAGACFAS